MFFNINFVLSFHHPQIAVTTFYTYSSLHCLYFNYITCLDTSVNYLSENVPAFSDLTELSYTKAYKKVMDGRHLVKHLVNSGETIDDIIKSYNTNIEDIDDFRKVVYKENIDIISSDYNIKSGEYILVPSE